MDAFSLEWTTPREIGGSLETNIDDAFLKAPNLNKIRWCIFYDFILRLGQTPDLKSVDYSHGLNFDDPKVYNTFVDDMLHFAKKYYSQPQYLKIDGRPVIYLWSTWSWKGKYAEAIAEARQKVKAEGYDVFLVADSVWANQFDKKLASQFDADFNIYLFDSRPEMELEKRSGRLGGCRQDLQGLDGQDEGMQPSLAALTWLTFSHHSLRSLITAWPSPTTIFMSPPKARIRSSPRQMWL